MNVTPLTIRSPAALLDELRSRGWDAGTATSTAGGVMPLAVRCTGLGDDTLQALVVFGGSHGLEVITGPGLGNHRRVTRATGRAGASVVRSGAAAGTRDVPWTGTPG